MSWHTDQLKYALGLGGLVTFYGFISLIVFVGGQQFGLKLNEQIVIVAIVLLTLPFALVIGYFLTRSKKKKEAAEQQQAASPAAPNVADGGAATNGQPAAAPPKVGAPSGKYEELTTNADTAVSFLKTSNLSGTKGAEAVYSLPFFVFAGTPRSGKTSLVLSSGLNFQTLPNQRQSEQTLVRPTRSTDWRVSSDAVILDTAGRYQTEGETDADEWSALLETLKKHRGSRPLDGFVLVANAEKLLNSDEGEIEEQAKVLRNRLDETMQRAKVRFPVYLVFTHADGIEGFRDSFSTSQQEGKTAILGATFPLEKTANAHSLFDAEFDALQQSFLKRRLFRLSAPFPPPRQLRIFNFPAHFNSTRRKLGHFVQTLFRPNPFSESPMFRGFYFTSSLPQAQQQRGASENAPVMQTVGTSYFAESFFRNVLLRDKNLTSTFLAQKTRPPVLGWILLVLGAFLIVSLLGLSVISFFNNRAMLAEAVERGKRVSEITEADRERNPLTKDANSTRVELEAVEELRKSVAVLDKYEPDRDGAPLLMRFGMYSGSQIYRERLLPIYVRSIEQRYKNFIVDNLKADLQKFADSPEQPNNGKPNEKQIKELDQNYNLLKVYLMLSGDYRSKAEPGFMARQLESYWIKAAPLEMDTFSKAQLEFYVTQVDRDNFPRIQLEKNLVDKVRQRIIKEYPAINRYYNDVVTEIDKKTDPVTVETVLAEVGTGGVQGTNKVPGSFTIEAYRSDWQKALAEAPVKLPEGSWVTDEKATGIQTTQNDIRTLQERYFNEYTDAWRKFARGVTIPKPKDKSEVVGTLRTFSDAQSPMDALVKEIARNTNLSAKPKSKDWWGWITSFFNTAKVTGDGNSQVEKEFKPLFAFVGDPDKPEESPATKYRGDLKTLLQKLERADFDRVTKDLNSDPVVDTAGVGKAESDVNSRLEAFKTPAGLDLVDLLKRPMDNVRSFFGVGGKEQLEKIWRDNIFMKAREIENGYPFSDAGEADLQKLTVYLNNADGTLSKFYTERLSKHFEESNGQLKIRDSAKDVGFTPEFISYLNNAFKLRQAMFGTSAAANFEYDFKLQPVKDGIVEVSIDGKKTDSATGTGSAKFTFPAPSGGETGVVMRFIGTGEPLAAPPVNNNANSSANSVNSNVNTNANISKAVPSNTNSGTNTAGDTSKTYQGQWGLFKMVDDGSPQKNQNGEYVLTYKLGKKTVTATVRPTGGDLFDKSIFRSLRAPEKMFK